MTHHARVLYSGTVISAEWPDRIRAAQAGGFDAISLFPHDVLAARAGGRSDDDLRRDLRDAGLAVAAIDPYTRWVPAWHPPSDAAPELLSFAGHSADEVLGMASALGATCLNVLEFWGVEVDVAAGADAFGAICDQAGGVGVRVHLETMPFSGVRDLERAWAIVERADRDNGGLLIDAWHAFRAGYDSDLVRSIPGDKIFAVQLSDAPLSPAPDLQDESMHSRLLPGLGQLDIARLLDDIASTGAAPTLGIEVFSDELAQRAPEEVGRLAGAALTEAVAGTPYEG